MRRARIVAVGALAALAALGVFEPVAPAHADPPLSVSDPLPTPGENLASVEAASAVAVNPGNLAWVPAPMLGWTMTRTNDDARLPVRGHTVEGAIPLWLFGGGVRVELHDPPKRAPTPFDTTYQWVRVGVAGRFDDWLGLGATLAGSISDSPSLDGQFGATVGATLRPTPWLSWGAVLRDFNVPVSRDEVTTSYRAWETGLALRPLAGKNDLELGLEGKFYDQLGQGQLRGTLGVTVPYVGRFHADAKWLDVGTSAPEYLASAGLDIQYGPGKVTGGAMFGNGLSYDADGFYVGAAFRWARHGGIPMPKRVARIDIDATPGVRGHTLLLRKLWRIAENDEIEGLILVMRDEPASSLAHAEEIVDALAQIRARGKKIGCHLEDAGGKALFVCSAADRIAMNPAGGLRFAGLSTRTFYFGGALQKLGIDADFVRIGAHKAAAEQLTQAGPSSVAEADRAALMTTYEARYLEQVEQGRGLTGLKATLDKGPFLATEARDHDLIDALVYPDELGAFVNEMMGRPVSIRKGPMFPEARKSWAQGDKIAIIYLAGDMVDGDSQTIPLINIRLAGSKTITAALRRAREDDSVKAVVFRIETGGGSSLAADVILREAKLLAKKKPLIVSMGSIAASGGYYVSVEGQTVLANRSTLTGSIGIFYGKVDLSGLLDKLGVGQSASRSGPRADAESLFRPFTDDEREELSRKVKSFYDLFVGRVADGRKLTADEVDRVGRGQVWTGREALGHRLVDREGGLRQALDEARALADLDEGTPLVEWPEEDDSLLGFLLKLVGLGASPMALPLGALDLARAFAPFFVMDSQIPMARAEVFEEGTFPKRFQGAIQDEDSIEAFEEP